MWFYVVATFPGKTTFYDWASHMNNGPITFPNWKEVLAQAVLSPQVKAAYIREILTFLQHCKKTHSPPTVAFIRQWLATREQAGDGSAHFALRWFYREGSRNQAAPDAIERKIRVRLGCPKSSDSDSGVI